MNIATISGLPRLHLMTLAYRCAGRGDSKPIHGGLFGGQFMLVRGRRSESGLVAASSYVVHSETAVAVGIGKEDAAALADARQTLAQYAPGAILEFIQGKEAEWQQREDRPRLPSISKRRREIFEASRGQCHYCDSPLTFDGAWHVEHRQPKSRGGSDASDNLAAACGLCNLRKMNKTEEEFCAEFGLRRRA